MQNIRRAITKEQYEEYQKMDRREFNSKIEKTIPIEWACGYGWYGCYLHEEDGNFYIVHTIGSSCD